jgi:hypothetical protein
MQPDPFKNDDKRWEPFQIVREEEEDLSMPDLASRNIADFVRSLIPREIEQAPEPQPEFGRAIGHIPGFP